MKKNAVIFDMDGVIFDSEKLSMKAWNEIAFKYNIPNIESTIKKCMGLSKEDSEKKMKSIYGYDFNYYKYKNEVSNLLSIWSNQGKLSLKKGVFEILTNLSQEKVPIALATTTEKKIVEKRLKDYKIDVFFDQIVCGDMVKKAKPDPEIYITACRKLNCSVDNCYAIEDSLNGVLSAYYAGLKVIMVPDLLEPTEDIRKMVISVEADLLNVNTYLSCRINY